jgi:hypothetical protein
VRYLNHMTSEPPRIVREAISLADVQELAQRGFGEMVKASVDIGRGIMAIGGAAIQSKIRRIVDNLIRR